MRKSLLIAAAFALVLTLPAAADGAAGCLAQELGITEMSIETGAETAEEIGLPEAMPMACSDTWYEYRWIPSGCCYNGWEYTWRDAEQRRHCCLQGPPNGGVTCGSWQFTGAAKCLNGPCPV